MTAVTKPRGRLPARVYWVRRTLLLVVVLAVVVGVTRLVGGSTGDPGDPVASPASAPTGPASTSPTPDASPSAAATTPAPTPTDTGSQPPASPTPTPLPAPTGPCRPDDVRVTPVIDAAVADDAISIPLEVTSVSSPACTWRVSAESLVLKLTSGDDRVWSTQDCPEAIEEQAVIVRKEHPATVQVTWSGRRSDDRCSGLTEWAEPGYYHAVAAALGSEPTDVQFRLVPPAAPTITPSPKPKQKGEPGHNSTHAPE